MSDKPTSPVSIEELIQLSAQPEALARISDLLRVKQMGPADHIRTKHEIKEFVQAASSESASALIQCAASRIEAGITSRERMTQRRGFRQET